VPLVLHPRVRALTALERLAVLALALAVFAFAAGPVWRHAWDPDAAILWSYAVIPPAVFAAFLRRGTPRAVPVVVESLLLAVVKFGISAFVLIGLWSFGAPPPAVRKGGLLVGMLGSKSPKIALSERESGGAGGALRGGAEDRAEAARAAAFAARVAAAQPVTVGDGGFSSKLISLAAGGEIALRATDGHLHAVQVLAADGSILRNVPVLGSGAPRLLSFEEISGGVSLRCAVHPQETAALALSSGR
jgi:hypothetical protein